MKVSDHLLLRVGLAQFQARFTNSPEKMAHWQSLVRGLGHFSLYQNIPFKPVAIDVPENKLEPQNVITGYLWSWRRDE